LNISFGEELGINLPKFQEIYPDCRHPGEILREEFLNPIGMSPHALSHSPSTRPLFRRRRSVVDEPANRLALSACCPRYVFTASDQPTAAHD
jgi:hypothetical protein